ncbi:uncharacterized protein LOC123699258 [Colias croceus]|uniref:uncharacterized protein LOC123699258 n=1 Tax=Colias crocea TaxID=72248 RepID=UPI001E27C713|nr:uncharacterized protein LOC123699258 [Colias croceus]
MSGARSVSRVRPWDSESAILKQYYRENVLFMSAEGVLKVVSVILCLISSVLHLTSGSCSGAPRLVSAAAVVALLSAATLACLFSGSALSITSYAPTGWLFTRNNCKVSANHIRYIIIFIDLNEMLQDIIISTVIGATLLVTGILSMALCEMEHPTDYVQGPLTIVNAGIATASGIVTYMSVIKRWDAAERSRQLQQPPPTEEDV